MISKHVRLPFDETAVNPNDRIASTGLMLRQEGDKMLVDMIEFGSPAEAAGIDFDWEITKVSLPAVRPMKEWVFVPTLLLLVALGWNQHRRAQLTQTSTTA